jgi:hypothetical protein
LKKKISKEEYYDAFWQLQKKYYQIQENEKIVQCHEPYPSYWFISNTGRLFSVWGRKKIKIVTPKLSKGNTNANRWGFKYDGRKNVFLSKLVAEHFLTEDFKKFAKEGERIEVHHTIPLKTFNDDEPYKANRADNLQILPKSIHQQVSDLKYTPEQRAKNRAKKAQNITLTEQGQKALMEIIAEAFVKGEAYLTLTDGKAAKAVKIDGWHIEEDTEEEDKE